MNRTWWEEQAACRDVPDPEVFFEVENATDEERMPNPVRIAAALDCCAVCPIRERCLAVGKETKSLGIWGGTTAAERGRKYRIMSPSTRR